MIDASLIEASKELKLRMQITRDDLLEIKAKLAIIFQFYPGTDNLISCFIGI